MAGRRRGGAPARPSPVSAGAAARCPSSGRARREALAPPGGQPCRTSPRAAGRAAAGAVPRRALHARWVQPRLSGGSFTAPCARRRRTRAGAAAGAHPQAGPGAAACRRRAPGGNGRGGWLLSAVLPAGRSLPTLRAVRPCTPPSTRVSPTPLKVVCGRHGGAPAAPEAPAPPADTARPALPGSAAGRGGRPVPVRVAAALPGNRSLARVGPVAPRGVFGFVL